MADVSRSTSDGTLSSRFAHFGDAQAHSRGNCIDDRVVEQDQRGFRGEGGDLRASRPEESRERENRHYSVLIGAAALLVDGPAVLTRIGARDLLARDQ